MRAIQRVRLPCKTLVWLFAKTKQLRKTTNDTRASEAQRLWESTRGALPRNVVKQALVAMTTRGLGLCMYCEHNTAHQVEHYWPKSTYPQQTFCWENLLLVCGECNTMKGRHFKVDVNNKPLFINPTTDLPEKHLELSPKEGRWIEHDGDLKGRHTAPLLNRGNLVKRRQDAWKSLQSHITLYAHFCLKADAEMIAHQRDVILQEPFPALLDSLLRFAAVPNPERYITVPGCLDAIHMHEAEFRAWLATAER